MAHRCRDKRSLRLWSDKKAVSDVLSATMLAGVVVTLGLVVYAWSQNVTSNFNSQLSETAITEADRLKEKLVFEYIFHNEGASESVVVYLLNCGTIDNVGILNVYVSNSSWLQNFPSPSLSFLNGTTMSDQDLDRGEEGYITLPVSTHLRDNAYYSVRIVTPRGVTFDSSFVA